MANSGVGCSDDILNKFNEQKLKKTCRSLVMKISDDKKQIELEGEPGQEANWEEFCNKLPANKCRYATYDFHYEVVGGGIRENLIFVSWCPDAASGKDKMLHASSKDAVKKKLDGLACEIHASDSGDLDYSDVLDRVKKAKGST